MSLKCLEDVLLHDYCCGCGACAGVCPHSVFDMRFNEQGEYRPYTLPDGKCTNCGLCSSVCPFVAGNANEDELSRNHFSGIPNRRHTSETGYYVDTFLGYVTDPNIRLNSASGGMATWLLEKLVTEKIVDYALCVSPKDDPDQLFRYTVCTNVEDIRKCSRSCYYPVTTQDILSFVAGNDGRYAIVGLPCVCKAIRLAQKHSKLLRDRITYVVGLVCGQTKSKYFVEYICALGESNPHMLQNVVFRIKDKLRPASDYGLQFTCKTDNGQKQQATIFWTQGMNRVWADRHFTPKSCDFCDDVFAECADVVFMDAWLPGYKKDWRGHNIVLCRKTEIAGFLQQSKNLLLKKIPIEMVISSQRGVVEEKRSSLAYRLFLARAKGEVIPRKRIEPSKTSLNFLKRLCIMYRRSITEASSKMWLTSGRDYAKYSSLMAPLTKKLQVLLKIRRFSAFPFIVIQKLKKKCYRKKSGKYLYKL